ncbi:MAG TPA: helix-turn-helix transcriptional regulator [Ktedonobacterales bacterium]|nr:helix-turn-helix transcriptional regulator [Ktedonobacterales bacterium]
MKLRGLRQARQRSGLSISQLAELTGLRRDTVTHLEHGKEDAQPYVLRRLAAALGASTAELVGVSVLESPPAESASRTPVMNGGGSPLYTKPA